MAEEIIKDKLGNIYFDTTQEVANKVKVCEKEVCPICESENINYSSIELEDESVYFPCYCTECGASWKEWHALEFTGNDSITIDEEL